MSPSLRVIDPHKDRRRRVRNGLAKAIRSLSRDPRLAGYALVVWDVRGAMGSAINASGGPIATDIVPAVVKARLDRHLASDMAEEAILGPPPDIGA